MQCNTRDVPVNIVRYAGESGDGIYPVINYINDTHPDTLGCRVASSVCCLVRQRWSITDDLSETDGLAEMVHHRWRGIDSVAVCVY